MLSHAIHSKTPKRLFATAIPFRSFHRIALRAGSPCVGQIRLAALLKASGLLMRAKTPFFRDFQVRIRNQPPADEKPHF
jgi:hypothetical protein